MIVGGGIAGDVNHATQHIHSGLFGASIGTEQARMA